MNEHGEVSPVDALAAYRQELIGRTKTEKLKFLSQFDAVREGRASFLNAIDKSATSLLKVGGFVSDAQWIQALLESGVPEQDVLAHLNKKEEIRRKAGEKEK